MIKSLKIISSVLLCAAALAFPSYAYDFRPGNIFLRPFAGAEINVLRYQGPGTATPGAGLLLGFGMDYVVDFDWGASGDIHANISPDYFDLSLSFGGKYWFTQTRLPFVPYAAVYLPVSVLIPTYAKSHWNIGLRPALGIQYFVMRNFAIGLEVGLTPSIMLSSVKSAFEISVDAAFMFSWRL